MERKVDGLGFGISRPSHPTFSKNLLEGANAEKVRPISVMDVPNSLQDLALKVSTQLTA